MHHDTPLIATIVFGLGIAFVFGAIANRLRIQPLVGYLVAGVMVGPFTPGFVADQSLAPELAEIGVILLMFGVGLHFSLKDLLSVRAIAVPGALAQIAFATLLGVGLAWLFGWGLGAGVVFGLALSVASTVVLLRALQERRILDTERGRIAVGWLIVEDLAMVLALVLLPALAGVLNGGDQLLEAEPLARELGVSSLAGVVGITLAKVAFFVMFMLVVGRRVIPWVLHYVAHTGSRELFRLAVLAIALGVAYAASQLFGVSLALGAFFAGMVLAESELSHRAAEESLPLRDAFAVLFFVSVGMLVDPSIVIEQPLPVLATLFIIVIGKSAAAFLIVLAFGHPLSTALVISASLAQIGEFSFILAELGIRLDLLPSEGRDLILAGAILSILLNPLIFAVLGWLRPRLERRMAGGPAHAEASAVAAPAVAEVEEEDVLHPTLLKGHTVLVGYGRVGSLVGTGLKGRSAPFLVIEDGDKQVARLHSAHIETIIGNAARADVLGAANLKAARRLVVAIPNAFEAGRVVEQARAVNPGIEIIVRAHSEAEVDHLTHLGADQVVMGEREIARGMLDRIDHPGRAPEPAGTVRGSSREAEGTPMAETKPDDRMSPAGLADPVKHRQAVVSETENRGQGPVASIEGPDAGAVEQPVGNSAGPDTSGAVVPPAAGNLPASSAELGGTPGALSTDEGRQLKDL